MECGFGSKFDERESETHTFYPTLYDYHYGIGSISGYNSFDQVCLTADECAPNFSFMSVAFMEDLEAFTVHGLIGLMPTPPGEPARFDLFTDKMKMEGLFDKSIFSFYVDLYGGNAGKITFGGYDEARYGYPGAEINFHDIVGEDRPGEWALTIERVTFLFLNGTVLNAADSAEEEPLILGENQNLVIDSGTSYLLMPYGERTRLLNALGGGLECSNDIWDVPICQYNQTGTVSWEQLEDSLPDIIIQIDDVEYVIT